MENFTIHIFGYGETQINSQDLSVKVSTNSLTTVTPLVEAIFSEKPADNTSTIDNFHAINIFGYNDVRWISKDTEGFSVENDDELTPLIDALIVELEATQTNTPAPKAK
jgi:hypothetical protein